MHQDNYDQLDEYGLQFDNDVRRELFETGKWARFMAIIVFIGCALVVIFMLFSGDKITSFIKSDLLASLGRSGLFFIVAAITILLALVLACYYFLFNFSKNIKEGFITESEAGINAGFTSLKKYFIISTIIAALSLVATVFEAITK